MKQLVICAVLAVAACGGSAGDGVTAPPAAGPLKLGIVSGNDQVVNAGATQLTAPVVGRLVRLPNATIAFHIESPAQRASERLLDLLVPRAFAQTVVTGSPVPGAVVCAVSVDTLHKLTPFTPCTNTAADGTATFFFTPGTTAGVATAQIRGTLNNSPAVFDTAKATVLAGAVAAITTRGGGGGALAPDGAMIENSGVVNAGVMATVGMRIAIRDLLPQCKDQYGNPVTPCSQVSWGIYPSSVPAAQMVAQSTADTIVVARPAGTTQSYNGGDAYVLMIFAGTGKLSTTLLIVNGTVSAWN